MRPFLGLSLIFFASCTTVAPQALPPSATAAVSGQIVTGTVASVRQFSISGGQEGGMNAVLAALGQSATAFPVSGEELVFLRYDGTPAAFARLKTHFGMVPGDRVAVVETALAMIAGGD